MGFPFVVASSIGDYAVVTCVAVPAGALRAGLFAAATHITSSSSDRCEFARPTRIIWVV